MTPTRRWGLAGLLTTLALASGLGAGAQVPSPAPPFAPHSLAALLPDEIAGEELVVMGWPPAGLSGILWPNGPDPIPAFLASLGREPADMRFATAFGDNSPLIIMAVRVDGVPGDRVSEGLLEVMFGAAAADDASPPPALVTGTEVISGQPVLVMRSTDQPGVSAWYSVGEVTFMVLAAGTDDDPDGLAPEAVATLRDSVEAARVAAPPPETQRIEFDDAGLAVTIPGDWTPYAGPLNIEGTMPDGFIGAFAGPVGLEVCGFETGSAPGRVTLDLVEAVASEAASSLDPAPGQSTVTRIETGAGKAVRLRMSQPIPFAETLVGDTVIYTFPWGDAFVRVTCFVARDTGTTSDETWLHVIETLEFLDEPAPGYSSEDVAATRNVLCSVVAPHGGARGDARRAHRSIARTGLAEVRRVARRFFRRHADEVSGFESPGTADTLGGVTDWFSGEVTQSRIDRQVRRLKGNASKKEPSRPTPNEVVVVETRHIDIAELMRVFAVLYGAFDDAALRADARRVAEAVYRYGSTSLGKDPAGMWRSINRDIDEHLRRHHLEPCVS